MQQHISSVDALPNDKEERLDDEHTISDIKSNFKNTNEKDNEI